VGQVLDLPGHRDRRDHRVTLDRQDLSDLAALSDQLERPVVVELQGRPDRLALQDLWVLLVLLAVLDQQALTEMQDHLAVQVVRVLKGRLGPSAVLEALDLQVCLDH